MYIIQLYKFNKSLIKYNYFLPLYSRARNTMGNV